MTRLCRCPRTKPIEECPASTCRYLRRRGWLCYLVLTSGVEEGSGSGAAFIEKHYHPTDRQTPFVFASKLTIGIGEKLIKVDCFVESLLPEGGQFLEGSHHAADFVDALADLVRAEVLLRDQGLADLVDGLKVGIANG